MIQTCSACGHGESLERHYGLYPGVVEETEDPDEKGRVTIRLPWIDPDFVTQWAPVNQHYAGDGYGIYWVPESKDQVIVAFLRGDLRKPIVVGSIYSRNRKPFEARLGGSDPKILRTKGGHMMLMQDGDSPLVRLIDKSGNNEVEINTDDNTVTVRAADKVVVEAGGNVTVEAGADLALSATGNITIDAGGSVTVSGTSIALN